MPLYLGLAVGALTLVGAAYVMLGKKTQKVTLDGLDSDKDNGKSSKSEDGETKSKQKRKGLEADIDENGPYDLTLQGTLTPESFLNFKRVVNRQTYACFAPHKTKLLEKRLRALKANDSSKYLETIAFANKTYQQYQYSVLKQCSKQISLDRSHYLQSEKEALAVPQIAAALKNDEDKSYLLRADAKRDLVESKDEIKQMYVDFLTQEGALGRKLG